MPPKEDEVGALEQARARLYETGPAAPVAPVAQAPSTPSVVPHAWDDASLPQSMPQPKKRGLHFAGIFFALAFIFFLASAGIAAYFLYFGGNSISTDKITLGIEGPTTIAGGDTVPLVITVVNTNSTAVDNATLEVTFPDGTRNADDPLASFPRYTENLGRLESGAKVTRSIKAIIFGTAGQTLTIPASVSYGQAGSNATFVKHPDSEYTLSITSTPLDVSVSTQSETVSGKPITLNLVVRSNSPVPIDNVAVVGAFPFGFTPTSSSVALSNSSFLLGTLAPGATKSISLTGTLEGQDGEDRVFRFSIGTTKTATDQTLAVTYMTQQASVAIAAPFISAALAINGDSSPNVVVPAGGQQNVTVTYANKLPTSVTNVTVKVSISGAGVDYNSIEASRGFYNSADHSVVFSQDKDSALASLAPGASGIGTFSFSTRAAAGLGASPQINFTVSVSGTRVGESNVPETVNASVVRTVKLATAVALSAIALHASGSIPNTGPIPPRPNLSTTYSVVWNVKNQGSAVADGRVTAKLPSYVTYTGKTGGVGNFAYDSASRTVSWTTGDLPQGGGAQGLFQVSITPSTSQANSSPTLTTALSFTGHDRYAGVPVSASASGATTETLNDPGYVSANGTVQP